MSYLRPLRQSSTDLGPTNYTTLTGEPKETLLSSPPSTGIRKTATTPCFFKSGDQTQVLTLESEAFSAKPKV